MQDGAERYCTQKPYLTLKRCRIATALKESADLREELVRSRGEALTMQRRLAEESAFAAQLREENNVLSAVIKGRASDLSRAETDIKTTQEWLKTLSERSV